MSEGDYGLDDKHGWTPLIQACFDSNYDLAETILDECTNINHRSYGLMNTALHWVCTRGHSEFAALLIIRGADVNILNRKKRTPLQQLRTFEEYQNLQRAVNWRKRKCMLMFVTGCAPLDSDIGVGWSVGKYLSDDFCVREILQFIYADELPNINETFQFSHLMIL